MEHALVTLPRGHWLDGRRHREAVLRPLGADDGFLLDVGDTFSTSERVTALLTCCLERVGPVAPVPAEVVDALTVGDREALLLHLRRLILGDRLECLLPCPACGERMELELSCGRLLVPPYPDARPVHELPLGGPGADRTVRFRLPTGADQRAAAEVAATDPEAAATLVLRRCVDDVTADGGPSFDELPPEAAGQLAAAMADRDPQAELRLRVDCPACAAAFSALLDTAAFLFQELADHARRLFWEVHQLALHYHWSEADIVALPPRRRRRYLGLLAEALPGTAPR